MNSIEARRILVRIQTLHRPQSTSPETAAVWADVLTIAGISDVDACVRAALEHFATPGASPWIQPQDVIARVRKNAPADRLARTVLPPPNVDPTATREWLAEHKAIIRAVKDGSLDVDAYTQGGWTLTGADPVAAPDTVEVTCPADVRGQIRALTRTALPKRVPGPDRGLTDPDAERARQAAALTELYGDPNANN